jgi:hypothetical protein
MFAGMMARPARDFRAHELRRQAFAQRDEIHFRRHVAALA